MGEQIANINRRFSEFALLSALDSARDGVHMGGGNYERME